MNHILEYWTFVPTKMKILGIIGIVVIYYIYKYQELISDKMKIIGAASLFSMAALICVDVVARYFKHPIFGSVEIVSFMGVLVVAMTLPNTHSTNGHIGVEILVRRLPDKAMTIIDFCTGIISLSFFMIVTWKMFDYGMKMERSGEVSMNLELPEYLLIFVVSICFIVFSCNIFKDVIDNFKKLREK
ncbi:TRAP transporter small permease [Desulfobacterales bacterium HSG16]|nr:TRAP transporter small permease [Desulfobacterales bacterium HSG16]